MVIKPLITYDDFAKLDLRIATVLQAELHPNADRLLKLQIDLGDEQRKICAGLRQYCEPGDLVGRQIVVVANLAPRTLRGEQSQGMLLAASETDGEQVKDIVLLGPCKPVANGSSVPVCPTLRMPNSRFRGPSAPKEDTPAGLSTKKRRPSTPTASWNSFFFCELIEPLGHFESVFDHFVGLKTKDRSRTKPHRVLEFVLDKSGGVVKRLCGLIQLFPAFEARNEDVGVREIF